VVLVARKPSDTVGKIHVLKNRELGPRGCGKFLVTFDEATWTIVEAPINNTVKEVTDGVASRSN
jgi:hypothetical protein